MGHVVSYAISGKHPMETKHVKAVVKKLDGYLDNWEAHAGPNHWDNKDRAALTKAKKLLEKNLK